MSEVLIVGAGPAGISAADVLVKHGICPVIIDEGRRPGGQAYRMPSPGLDFDMEAFLGSEGWKYRRIHEKFAAVQPMVDYRPETLAWNVFGRSLHISSANGAESLPYDALIVAAGATDRLLPVRGWTTPGVFTLGGAQIILKDQGLLIGKKLVFCGASPLLYLAALQYIRMGAQVAAILDTTPWRSKANSALELLSGASTAARGARYMALLYARGVDIRFGVKLESIEGDDRVECIVYIDGKGCEHRLECDAVALGFGLRPETQLVELAGGKLRYEDTFRQWFPDSDEDGRCGDGLYVAGDGCAIGGADAAELSGQLAAYASLDDLGVVGADRTVLNGLRKKLRRWRRFQRGLAKTFAWPHQWLQDIQGDVVVCRCENISVGEIRAAVGRDVGAHDVNRVKAITRCGMGRCQGRFCGLSSAEITAVELKRPLSEIGHLRAQAPVKPLPIAVTEK